MALASIAPELIVFDDLRAPHLLTYRIREARSAAPQAKIVVLTVALDAARMAALANAGADAAIARELDAARLATLLREVEAGTVYHVLTRPGEAPAALRDDALTTRELETLRLVAAGLANGSVARRMRVTERTVAFHLSNVYRKLGVANRTEASHYAHIHGLLTGRGTDVAPAEAA